MLYNRLFSNWAQLLIEPNNPSSEWSVLITLESMQSLMGDRGDCLGIHLTEYPGSLCLALSICLEPDPF